MISFIIPGEPKGKARPRFGQGRTYTPPETVEYEKLVKRCYLESGGKINLSERPIKIQIYAYFGVPKSWSNKKKTAAVHDEIYPTKKPDCDNIVKIICDALNLVAYKDDSQIVECTCIKRYGTQGGVSVVIDEL